MFKYEVVVSCKLKMLVMLHIHVLKVWCSISTIKLHLKPALETQFTIWQFWGLMSRT